jgi:hypothetical protein
MAAKLHAHADALEHAAALGGFQLAAGSLTRRRFAQWERDQWARDAALIREAAYRLEQGVVEDSLA